MCDSGKCPFEEMSIRENVIPGIVSWEKSVKGIVCSGNRPSGNYPPEDCQSGKYLSGNCLSGNCPSEKCPSGNYNSSTFP